MDDDLALALRLQEEEQSRHPPAGEEDEAYARQLQREEEEMAQVGHLSSQRVPHPGIHPHFLTSAEQQPSPLRQQQNLQVRHMSVSFWSGM